MEPKTVTNALATLVVLSAVVNVCFASPLPPLCEPGIVDGLPQHIRKVCNALENSNQLSNALNAYIKNEAAELLYRGEDLAVGSTGKRTDVDHVFLRFGRRR